MNTLTTTCDVCHKETTAAEGWYRISLGRGIFLESNTRPAWICVQHSQDFAAVTPIAAVVLDACSEACVMQTMNAFLRGGNVPAKQPQSQTKQIQ